MNASVHGYELRQLIRRTRSATVYRARRVVDDLEVIAKFYDPFEDGSEARYEHEFELLRSLEVSGAVRAVDLRRAGPSWVLILEAFPGVDLREFTAGQALELEVFFAIAIEITKILAAIHERGVIHRDIKPSSILYNPQNGEVCLADFGLSVALERDHREIYDPGVLAGTLPYIAPEQTGRTARAVDHRSDLYSLGTTFYELLTGRPPFVARDPMALVHAHLARVPLPVHLRRPGVPEVLARIVDRLIAKDPADRYQSAAGLLADLERCHRELAAGRREGFEIGREDRGPGLELPDRLYGRAAELTRINAAFERCCRGARELVLVAGDPGLGKTALIQTLQGPIAARGGDFVSGKFEQFRTTVPFFGLSQALSSLVERLLVQDDASLDLLRRQLHERLGPLVEDLLPLVPKLARLLDLREPGEEARADALAARNRALVALARLLGVVASPSRPVALVLDDLQWSDPASVRALEYLHSGGDAEGILGLMLVGTYRSGEVPAGHPLSELLARFPSAVLPLAGLDREAVTQLVGDALRVPADRAEELASFLAGRTDNNPLLIRQLLDLLARSDLLTRGEAGWSWSLESIRKAGISPDALAMVQAKLEDLAEGPRQALAAATCIGSQFELATLAAALERPAAELYAELLTLVDAGLLAVASEGFRFTHDRIEEAARAGLAADDERRYHARVGRHLRRLLPDAEIERAASSQAGAASGALASIYALVDHLEWTLDDEGEIDRLLDLARLEAIAGRAAIRAAALDMAVHHLQAGRAAVERVRALDPHAALDPRLVFGLRVDEARALGLAGQREASATRFSTLLAELDDALDWARVGLARVEVSAATGRGEEAIEWGLQALAKLGLPHDRYPSPERVGARFEQLRQAYDPKTRAGLAELPDTEDEADALRAELLVRLVLSAFVGGGLLGPDLITSAGLETLRCGRTPYTAQVFGLVAVGLSSVGGDHEAATELIELALADLERPGSSAADYVINTAYSGVLHWTRPYRECRAGMEAAYEAAMQAGNLELAVHDLIHRTSFELALGEPLERLLGRARETARAAASNGVEDFAKAMQSAVQAVLELSGLAPRGEEDESPAEARARIESIELPSARALAITFALHAPVFLHDPEPALALAEPIADQADEALLAVHFLPQFWFAYGMAVAMAHAPGDDPTRWSALCDAHGRMSEWAKVYADNLGPRAELLAAEIARLEGRALEAEAHYDRAASSASDAGFPHIEALAWERLARARMTAGRGAVLTDAALARARALYLSWGAEPKVALLDGDFPMLAERDREPVRAGSESDSGTSTRRGHALDLESVIKGSQGITRGRTRAEVVNRVLAAAIENAGARRGVLITAVDGALELVLEHDHEGPSPRIRDPLPLDDATAIVPIALVRLVARTGEARIIADAQADPKFAGELVAHDLAPRSICCLPITSQNRVVAVLYLDNPLAAGVFTPERLEILEHLAAQAAITLESARLMDALRDSEAQWRSLVDHAPVGIAIVDRRGRVEFINRLGAGPRVDALVGRPITELFTGEFFDTVTEAVARVFATGEHAAFEAAVEGPEGERAHWSTQLGPIFRGDEVHRVTLISADISEQRALEAQLRQAQKMEAIGTLAGGVAHDFNNLLSVILGSADLALSGLMAAEPALREVLAAAERAGTLTRQLLAFSRRQVLQPRVLELDARVAEMSKLLRRLLGERVELRSELDAAGGQVRVDPGQLEQVVLNLVVNARDAMPRGGTIRLRSRVDRDADGAPREIVLSVCDQGEGMDDATRERIFEPYFTTKAPGSGTGLGLSTVHGIVSQSGGRIEVESSPGEGARFHVFLPAVVAEGEGEDAAAEVAPRGTETILLVEDEPGVRKLAATILELQGYTVLEAGAAGAALALAEASDPFDLLVTDIVLPGGVNGRELAEQLRARQPRLPVLYMSGYTDDALVRDGVDGQSAEFLQKPFTRESLTTRVRALLD